MTVTDAFKEVSIRELGDVGFPPRLESPEILRETDETRDVAGDCPNCGFRGTATVHFGWNDYVNCPECSDLLIVTS